jgi:hypothetical protein
VGRRGRPPVDDGPVLRKAAMKLAKGEARTPRSAIVQSLAGQDLPRSTTEESHLVRLQRKWREYGSTLLDEAHSILIRQREEAERRAREVDRGGYYGGIGPSITGEIARLAALGSAIDPSYSRAASTLARILQAEREAFGRLASGGFAARAALEATLAARDHGLIATMPSTAEQIRAEMERLDRHVLSGDRAQDTAREAQQALGSYHLGDHWQKFGR